ncbi:MAG TPA: transketolase C-terminal domain-containing protein [Candidatus Acidoferrales bacterium]|nr:transketolase C-terminal domain-containing protein [Candidatus Acidoferrales bacterium]
MVEKDEMRVVYCNTLIDLAKKDDRIIVLDSDLAGACGTKAFGQCFPQRYINAGIAEANMVGVAAGLAASGKIPFVHSFAAFATRRCFDQLTVSVGFTGLNVKIAGTDPGIAAEANGGTHMALEDVGIMRTLPNMVIFEPVDSIQLHKALPQIASYDGPVYMRLLRKKAESVFRESYNFKLGKADPLRDGKDVSIFATGLTVKNAIDAAEYLDREGIIAQVINIHTVQPLDIESVVSAAEKTRAVVTVENHNVVGGLGSAVAEVLGEHCPTPMYRVGVRGRFGEVGNKDYLMQLMGITAKDICAAVRIVLGKKRVN